jgi:hypothetical protein
MSEILLEDDVREDAILYEYDGIEKFYLVVMIISFVVFLVSGIISMT